MSTIQELIDRGEVILGETAITPSERGLKFIPMGKGREYSGGPLRWFGQYDDGRIDWRSTDYNRWQIFQEPVEMEDRWQWASDDGLDSTCGWYATAEEALDEEHWTDPPEAVKRLDYTKTQFPKER